MNYKINCDDDFISMYGSTISIPAGAIVWREFDLQFPVISDRPAYYGSYKFAKGYADKYGIEPRKIIQCYCSRTRSNPINI
jgi:hypothetical protein